MRLVEEEDKLGLVGVAHLGQLSNRIQHGLRAYTPAEQKAVKAAAKAFRANPSFDSEAALQELGTGEALVSFLAEDGSPSVVERAMVLAPSCSMGAAEPATMDAVIAGQAALMDKYGTAVDRESAFEMIDAKRAEDEAAQAAALAAAEEEKRQAELAKEEQKKAAAAEKAAAKEAERQAKAAAKEAERQAKAAERQQAKTMDAVTSIIGQMGREAGRQIMRGLFGNMRR